jgi:Family of unknown function (DUF5670)
MMMLLSVAAMASLFRPPEQQKTRLQRFYEFQIIVPCSVYETYIRKSVPMLWTIVVILVVLWLLGLIGGVGGSVIHVLLVLALIVIVVNLLSGRRGTAL